MKTHLLIRGGQLQVFQILIIKEFWEKWKHFPTPAWQIQENLANFSQEFMEGPKI